MTPIHRKLLKHEGFALLTPILLLLPLFAANIGNIGMFAVKVEFFCFVILLASFVFLMVNRRRNAYEKKFREEIRAIVFDTNEAIVIMDGHANILDVNAEFCLITGFDREEVIGLPGAVFESDIHGKKFYASMLEKANHDNKWTGEVFDRRKNGEIYVKWLSISVIRDEADNVISYVSKFYDMSVHQTEDMLTNTASSDILTGLPNRRRIQNALAQSINYIKITNHCGAIISVNLDNFKRVNNLHGHDIGDLLLIESARRVESCITNNEMVARTGGDEFIVLIADAGATHEESHHLANTIATNIMSAFYEPMLFAGKIFNIGTSIGVAFFDSKTNSSEDVLKHAAAAMHISKTQGKNRINLCSADMAQKLEESLYIENSLREAIANNEMSLAFQPKVNHEGLLSGGEALIRWTKNGRSIPPLDFIKIAEETGLILKIGFWVLEKTCSQIFEWEKDSILPRDFYLSVNVSPIQLRQQNFATDMINIIDRVGVSRKRIKVEITESSIIESVEDAIAKIKFLRDHGVDVVMDDFGTGYSSLSYLRKLPISQIKIDKSFVDNIEFNSEDEAVISMIISLGRVLRVSVLAEGVENERQYRMLEMAGCGYFQGYYFGKPVNGAGFDDLLRNGSKSIRIR